MMVLQETTSDDLELLELIKKDDLNAFDQLYGKYFDRIYHLVYKTVDSKKLTKSIVIKVFSDLWEKRAAIETASPEKYLFVCTCMEISRVLRPQVKNQWINNLLRYRYLLGRRRSPIFR
jgi:DNA-directed RNA polymerase specialized sigma24 family protein